jgi:6-phosphogluconolactonase (cycloisomerase 2 family)
MEVETMKGLCAALGLGSFLALLEPNLARAQSDFVYTNDDVVGANTVSGFSVAQNGVLTPLAGSPFPTGGSGSGGGLFAANRVTVSAAGGFLFTANSAVGSISVFSIDPATGNLAPVPGSPFATSGFVDLTLAATPDGRFLIAGHSFPAPGFSVFEIRADGALSQVPGSPFSSGLPAGIQVTSDGRFLAAAFPNFGFLGTAMAMLAIAPDGSLTPVPGSPFPGGPGVATGVDVRCEGDRLFVGEASFGDTIVDVFAIAPDGSLTPIPGSPFGGTGLNSNVVLLSPDDQHLFVSNQLSDSVTAFDVAADGSLSLVAGSPFAVGASTPAGLATNAAGTLLYTANDDASVSVFSITADGALVPAPGSPFSTGLRFGLASLAAFPPKTCGLEVEIDIKPGGDVNPINRNSRQIPLAILGSNDFDVTDVDLATMAFGPGGATERHKAGGHFEDVNGDRRLDLVGHFGTEDADIPPDATEACVSGRTLGGARFVGCDSVRPKCGIGFELALGMAPLLWLRSRRRNS